MVQRRAQDVRRSSRQKPAASSKADALQDIHKKRQQRSDEAALAQTLEDEEEPEAPVEDNTDDEGAFSDQGMDIAEELREDAELEDADEASFDDILEMQVCKP